MSSTDPTITNIANILAKVTEFLPEQDAINADISQRLATHETALVKISQHIQDLVSCLSSRQIPLPSTQDTSPTSSTVSPASNDAPVKPNVTPSWADIARCPTSPLTDRKRQALHRIFSPQDSASSDATSYTFVYLPSSRRMTRTEIRSKFRALSIDNLRVLDIIFPARHTIGILLHEAYISEFRSKLLEIDTSLITDFNPLDPIHIANPKFHDLPLEDRSRLARTLHQDRCLRTLSLIRPNLLPGIAKYFIRQGWVSDNLAKDIINKRIPHPVQRRRLPPSSVTAVLQQISQSSLKDSAPPVGNLSPPSPSQISSQTQQMDTSPDFVSNASNSTPSQHQPPSPPPSPRKLRRSSRNRRLKS